MPFTMTLINKTKFINYTDFIVYGCCTNILINLSLLMSVYSPNSTWLVTSRHDTTRSKYRARRAVLFDKLDTAKMHGLDTSNVSCHVETSQVEFGFMWLYCIVRLSTCIKRICLYVFFPI